jgi:SAM-dependent methyltransferase
VHRLVPYKQPELLMEAFRDLPFRLTIRWAGRDAGGPRYDRRVGAAELVIYNLGCGTRTHPACVNVDWSIHLRLRKLHLSSVAGSRAAKIRALPRDIVVHDLRKGIPARDATVDVVYHSHVLEHIDREDAPGFMAEVHRVLKPGGVQRVVVPDFEHLTRRYVEAFGGEGHEARIADIIEQIVRREAAGTASQHPFRRRIENALLGDARKRGETHQWMYDRLSLTVLLETCGFTAISVVDHATSRIPGWNSLGLDVEPDGQPYKPHSLYIEAEKG